MTEDKIAKIKFLSDLPLAADEEQEVRFGHIGIARSLSEIILKCPTPFTIGLFGKWGSGKTTIINILNEKLEDSKIPMVNFDVWKHEDDALRRTFLTEITKELKRKEHLPKDYKLSERLENSISRTFEGRFAFNKSKIRLLIDLIIAAGVGACSFFIFWPQSLDTYLSIIFSGSIVGTFFLWLLQQALTTQTITSATDRFKDPHEFETQFKNIVDEISSERLVVAIDNLDRTSHEKAVELLSTIKTFLEQKKCIFLIACDDEAIKKHLESAYTKGAEALPKDQMPFDTDEFLRKFFNTFQRVPDFIDIELQTYTEDLLRETGAPQFDSPDIAYIITSAFRENPRQIKQFINTLLANFLLAVERENGSEPLIVPKGAITDNVAFLTKFLIIRQQFSPEYQQIQESYLIPDEVENNNKKFKDFLRATRLITVSNIRPFIYLKQSKEELSIPGVTEVEFALVDNNVESLKEKIELLKANPEQIRNLGRCINSLIDRNKNMRIALLNIVTSSLIALKHHNLEFDQHYYDKVADLLNDDNILGAELERFGPSLIFNEVLRRCNKSDRGGIIERYINIFSKPQEGGEQK